MPQIPLTPLGYLTAMRLRNPQPGRLAIPGATSCAAPTSNNWDMSLFKNEHLTERLNMQIRAELFNAFNHTELGPFPGTGFNLAPSSSFAIYQSTQHDARVIQLALKLIF